MVGICKDDFGAKLFQRLVPQAFYCRLRAHGHEERRLHRAVRRAQNAPPRARRIRCSYFKRKIHPLSVSGENPRNCREEEIEAKKESERNGQRLAERQFFRIGRGKTEGDENHSPDSEDVDRGQEGRSPNRRIRAKKNGGIGCKKIFWINRRGVFE